MLLDTFMIMFEADASSLDDGLDDSEKKSKKLTDSVEDADEASKKLGDSFSNMLATAGGALAAAFSVGKMISGINAANDYADAIGKLSDSIGENATEVAAWSDLVEMAGGSAESFQGSLKMLSGEFQSIATTGTSGTLPFFQRLGVDIRDANGEMRSALDVLPELAEKFETMSKTESMGFGQKLGLDEGTIMLLQQGRREVEAQLAKQRELSKVTKEQTEMSAEYNNALSQMNIAFRGMFLSVGQSVIPAFKWIAEVITDLVMFFKKHSDFMVGLLIALGTAISVFVIPPLYAAGAAAVVAFAPFLLIGAAVAAASAAFALLYDDIQNFLAGNESMIGDISKDYPFVGELIHSLIDSFELLFSVLTKVGQFLIDVFTDPQKAITDMIDAIGSSFKAMGDFIMSIWEMVIGTITSGVDAVKGVIGSVKSFFGFDDTEIKGLTEKQVNSAMNITQSAAGTPLNGMNSSAISNSKTSNNTNSVTVGKVEVNTQATDADGIARSVGGQLQDQLKKATANYDDGVLA